MATIAEQLTSLANTKTAIKDAIVAKGVSVADTDTFASYADKIGQIETGGGGEVVNKEKLGVTVDTFLGDVDADGTLGTASGSVAVDFSGVNKIAGSALRYKFYGSFAVTDVLAQSLITVKSYGLHAAFYGCVYLKNADFNSLQTVEDYGMHSAFEACSGLKSITLGSLQTVGTCGMINLCHSNHSLTSVSLESLHTVGQSGLWGAFLSCFKLESVNLDSLQTVGAKGLAYAFSYCKSLTSISFPSLTSVVTDSFVGSTSVMSQMFYQCTALTEIHFRADMQAAIESTNGYANKWGATNATIYFDL